MASVPTLLALNVGIPQTLGEGVSANKMFGRWSTGIFKQAISGPVWVGKTNIQGDGQADLTVHGGPDKAILAYSDSHYPDWRTELGITDFPFGAFGENFTITGMDESSISIGEVHQLGSALLQIAQPRFPCWKLARKWNRPDLPMRVNKTGRSGWYYRVLQEGEIEFGQEFRVVERPFPQWTAARVNQLTFSSYRHGTEAAELAACPLLARAWRQIIIGGDPGE